MQNAGGTYEVSRFQANLILKMIQDYRLGLLALQVLPSMFCLIPVSVNADGDEIQGITELTVRLSKVSPQEI